MTTMESISVACQMPWFWLASIERDQDGEDSVALHLVMVSRVMTVDRFQGAGHSGTVDLVTEEYSNTQRGTEP